MGRFKSVVKRNLKSTIAMAEQMYIKNKGNITYPPVIIVGPPRVGTTLIYQCLVNSLSISYFCNMAANNYLFPALTTKLISCVKPVKPANNFENHYGVVPGWSSPSQGNKIWQRWFPADQSFVDENYLQDSQVDEIQRTIGAIEGVFSEPFINKVQGHAVRLRALKKIFNKFVIIKINREKFFTAQSILIGRRQVFKDDSHWFSAKPKNYESLKNLSPFLQISRYIDEIEKDMVDDIQRIGLTDHTFEIEYEDFCSDPCGMIRSFKDFYHNISNKELNFSPVIPTQFEVDRQILISPEEEKQLRSYL